MTLVYGLLNQIHKYLTRHSIACHFGTISLQVKELKPKMSEKYQRLSGKWRKMNDSGFEEFEAKNPGLATGKVGHNTKDIKLEYTMNADGYVGSVSVDGITQSCSFAYDGTLEHKIGSEVSFFEHLFQQTLFMYFVERVFRRSVCFSSNKLCF